MAQGKPGAPRGNKNRTVPVDQRKPPTFQVNVSLDRDRVEMLRQAMIAQNGGHYPEDNEVKACLRSLARQAVDAFIERAERDHEGAMIV